MKYGYYYLDGIIKDVKWLVSILYYHNSFVSRLKIAGVVGDL